VAASVKTYAKHTLLRSTVVFGGIDIKPQAAELKTGVEVLIATPGRLLDHIESKNCVLNQVEYVVLDEADRMLDIGFLPDLQRILSYLPQQRQTLLFSATFSPEIRRLAQSYLQDPVTVEVAQRNATASTVEQHFFSVIDDDKRKAVRQLVARRELSQALVFVNSKLGAARLARAFERDGLNTTALHGDKSQDERLKALDAFKRGEVQLLVATDVAARGLDIVDLPAVFNYDVPFNAEDYVHRIGRTGRAGQSGLSVTLVTRDDTRMVFGFAKARVRGARHEIVGPLGCLFGVRFHCLLHFAGDGEAGRKHVGSNAFLAPACTDMACQRVHARLGHCVAGPRRLTAMRRTGASVDDRALAALYEVRHHGAGAQQMPAQVDRDRAVEGRKIDRKRVAILHDDAQVRRVDMRAVKAAKAAHRLLGRLLHRSLIGNVDMDGKGFPTRFLRNLGCAFDVDVGRADPRAFFGQAPDGSSADTGGAAEHDDTTASETIVDHEHPPEKLQG